LKDLFPALAISITMALIVNFIYLFLPSVSTLSLLFIIIVGILSYIGLSIMFQVEEFRNIKETFLKFLSEWKSRRNT
jgi:hypothetical protein